jgi:thiamine kinase-like enzyme
LVRRESADIVIHGDIWANNFLFSKSGNNECIMVDWQFTSTSECTTSRNSAKS